MAVYQVTWTAKVWFTRVIEADSRREAVEISEDMGDGGVEIDFPETKFSEMKAKEVKDERA